jgi:ABC-type sugar transport system ATPase subunit
VVENLGSTSFAYATTRNGGSLIVELESADQVKAGHEADIGFDPKSAFLFDLETGLRL